MTRKQKAFIEGVIATGNATEAAAQVYNCKNRKVAEVIGRQNLRKIGIGEEIERRTAEIHANLEAKTEVTREKIIRELARVAFTDISDFCDWNPSGIALKSMEDLSPDALAAIAEVRERMGADGASSISVKRWDKIKALELLGKTPEYAMFEDRVVHEGNVRKPITFVRVATEEDNQDNQDVIDGEIVKALPDR